MDKCSSPRDAGEQITPPPRDYTPKGDCHNFTKEQKCRFGDRCRFLHGPEDKRTTYRPERPTKEEETATGERQVPCAFIRCSISCSMLSRARPFIQICRNFRDRGRCRFGDKCKHLHVAGEGKKEEKKAGTGAAADGDKPKRRRRVRGPKKDGAAAGAGASPAPKPAAEKQVLKEEDKYDAEGVELCRNFRNTGRCRFG